MKKYLLLISMFVLGLTGTGRIQAQQVVAAAVGNSQNGKTVIEWTLGESVRETLTNGNIILTQGFQQPTLVVTAIKTLEGLPFTLDAYPNPINNLVLIKLGNAEARDFEYLLFDINGKALEQKKLTSDITAINMDNYPVGVYLLELMQCEKEVKTFQVVKTVKD